MITSTERIAQINLLFIGTKMFNFNHNNICKELGKTANAYTCAYKFEEKNNLSPEA